jgi:uncharacterized protein (TIGR00369 family)
MTHPTPDAMNITTLQAWLDSSPYIRFLALKCDEMDADAGTLTMTMPTRAELERIAGSGQFHGGPIAGLIDTVGCFAVVMGTRAPVPTVNFRVDYLRPSSGPFLVGKALVRRAGKTAAVVDVDVFDSNGRLTAVGRCCFGAAGN